MRTQHLLHSVVTFLGMFATSLSEACSQLGSDGPFCKSESNIAAGNGTFTCWLCFGSWNFVNIDLVNNRHSPPQSKWQSTRQEGEGGYKSFMHLHHRIIQCTVSIVNWSFARPYTVLQVWHYMLLTWTNGLSASDHVRVVISRWLQHTGPISSAKASTNV